MSRVLIADDEDAHPTVAGPQSGESGPTKLKKRRMATPRSRRSTSCAFDIVLTDLKMAGSSGLDVLRTARALHPSTAVIVMTSFGSVKIAIEAIKEGAFDFMEKPFRFDEIESRIATFLQGRRRTDGATETVAR